MNMLSGYAIGHLRMVEIDRRFNAVIARHPMRDSWPMKHRVNLARIEANFCNKSFPNYYTLCELALMKKLSN